MSTEENKAIVKRFYDEALNKGDMSAAEEILASNYVDDGELLGIVGFKQFFSMVSSVFPDIQVKIEDMVVEGDKVAVRLTVHGTQKGSFRGFPPTDKHATWTGMDFLRLAGGKIAERWSVRDFLSMLQQVGAIPTLGRG